MSAVESRLAATLAKHPLYAGDDHDVCKCGWEPDYEAVDFTAGAAIPAHLQQTGMRGAVLVATRALEEFVIDGDVFLDGDLIETPCAESLAADLLAAVHHKLTQENRS